MGGRGRVGGVRVGCEPRIEVFVKIQKKNFFGGSEWMFFFGGGGSGGGGVGGGGGSGEGSGWM